MRLALIFLMAALVVTTHQYYFNDQPMQMARWLSPYSPAAAHPFINKYNQPLIVYYTRSNPPTVQSSQFADSMDANDAAQPYVFPDTKLRIKGLSSSDLNEESSARFLYNLFASSGTYTNLFFKTATFTSTSSLSLTSYVTCVPSNQLLNGAAAVACRRKRNIEDIIVNHPRTPEDYSINPSETVKLMPTSLLTPPHNFNSISSSKDEDVIFNEKSATANAESNQLTRDKRFWFVNKNQFVVSSTVTSYSFSNSTVTITKNLFAANQAVACAAAPAANVPQCIACLPTGYVVCAASG